MIQSWVQGFRGVGPASTPEVTAGSSPLNSQVGKTQHLRWVVFVQMVEIGAQKLGYWLASLACYDR